MQFAEITSGNFQRVMTKDLSPFSVTQFDNNPQPG
jgi:hypothetical protein